MHSLFDKISKETGLSIGEVEQFWPAAKEACVPKKSRIQRRAQSQIAPAHYHDAIAKLRELAFAERDRHLNAMNPVAPAPEEGTETDDGSEQTA